jgi:hypothetical protein
VEGVVALNDLARLGEQLLLRAAANVLPGAEDEYERGVGGEYVVV